MVGQPPRYVKLYSAAERAGLLGKWMYRSHLEVAFRRLDVGSQNKDGFDRVWDERGGLLEEKSGLPRRVGELLGRRMRPEDAVLWVDSYASAIEAREFFTNFQFAMGAHGGYLDQYPVADCGFRFSLIRVADQGVLERFIQDTNVERQSKNPTGSRWNGMPGGNPNFKQTFSAFLGIDPDPGQPTMSEAEVQASPLATPASGLALTFREQKVEELQRKLADLVKSLQ